VQVQNKDEINRKQRENREKRENIYEFNRKIRKNREANKDEVKGITNDNYYFYIIQFPECGSSKINSGIPANIYARFENYQQHLFGSDIIIHRLQKLPKQIKDRYGDNAQKLYEVYEREAKHLLEF